MTVTINGSSGLTTNDGSVFADASGNVGIGTSSPSFKMQITAPVVNNAVSVAQLITNSGTGNAGSGIGLGYGTGNGYYAQLAGIYDNTGSTFTVSTSALGVAAAERMRIDSSGNVGIGTTSIGNKFVVVSPDTNNVIATFGNTSASPYGLLVDFTSDPNNGTNYGFKFRLTNNTNIYTIFSNGTTSARSDARFKKDIETTRDGYAEDLSKLRVVKYRWHNADDTAPKELGFIAQEVEQVFPNLISTEMNDDGIDVKSIKTSVFVPMLVKAIQEQQALITALTTRITALEAANV
jgi:hypothetical protein